MSDDLEENTRYKLYIWLSEINNEKNILWRVTIFFIYQRMGDRYALFIIKVGCT